LADAPLGPLAVVAEGAGLGVPTEGVTRGDGAVRAVGPDGAAATDPLQTALLALPGLLQS
jgi:hypothetical protein